MIESFFKSPYKNYYFFGITIFVIAIILNIIIASDILQNQEERNNTNIDSNSNFRIGVQISNQNQIRSYSSKIGETISNDSGSLFVSTSSSEVISFDRSEFRFVSETSFSFIEGTFLILPKVDTRIEHVNANIILKKGGVFIFESGGIITTLEGQATIGNTEILSNKQVNLRASMIPMDFNRSSLSDVESYRGLVLATSVFNKSIPSLTDLVGPRLISISPTSGSALYNRSVRISGRTEPNAQVSIGTELAEMDSLGNFAITTYLVLGENDIELKLLDEYGNITIENLTYDYVGEPNQI